MDDMMDQGDEQESQDNAGEEGSEISIPSGQLDRNAQQGDSVSGTWEGTVKSVGKDGSGTATITSVSADKANQADSALRDLGGAGDMSDQ